MSKVRTNVTFSIEWDGIRDPKYPENNENIEIQIRGLMDGCSELVVIHQHILNDDYDIVSQSTLIGVESDKLPFVMKAMRMTEEWLRFCMSIPNAETRGVRNMDVIKRDLELSPQPSAQKVTDAQIIDTLKECCNSRTKTAKLLNVTRETIQRRIRSMKNNT
jgi:DNA-binding NtrC family response regulator